MAPKRKPSPEVERVRDERRRAREGADERKRERKLERASAAERRREERRQERQRVVEGKRERKLERERAGERKRERKLARVRAAEHKREERRLARERAAEHKQERRLERERAAEHRRQERELERTRAAERKQKARGLERERPGRREREGEPQRGREHSVKQNKDYRVAMKNRPERVDGTPLEAYFSVQPRPADEPVLIFQHIQKTAGTAIRQILHRNYLRDGNELMVRDAPRQKGDQEPLRSWYRDFHSSLSDAQRAGLMCVACHSANHMRNLLDRPSRAFTMLREPLDRVMSRYYFFRPENRPRTLQDVYRELDDERRRFHFVNWQSRSLLAPHWGMRELPASPDAPDADEWRERLFAIVDEHYTVGLQDRFDESVKLFADAFGWPEVFLPRVRVNRVRPRELDDAGLRAEILAHNWLDVELYERAAGSFRTLGAVNDLDPTATRPDPLIG